MGLRIQTGNAFAAVRHAARGTVRHLASLLLTMALVGSGLVPTPSAAAADITITASGWSGPAGSTTLQDVVAGRTPMRPMSSRTVHPLGEGQELWLKLRFDGRTGPAEPLMLEFPFPILDRVTVHQKAANGGWTAVSAGDRIDMSAWPVAGRYPAFALQAGTSEVYVQVRHATALTLPMQVSRAEAFRQRVQFEYLGLGLAIGAIAWMVAGCLLRSWTSNDRANRLLAVHAVLSLLAVASATGVAAHLLWGDSGSWVDLAPGCLTALAACMTTFITGNLTAASARMPRLGLALRALGWLGLPLAAAFVVVERANALALLGVYLLGVVVLGIAAVIGTWRRGDVVGRWMLLGAVPLAVAVLVSLARVLGWIEASWLTEYSLVLALTLNLPLLLGALNSRSHERRGAQLRQKLAENQDPLTGLPRAKVFHARVLHALRRHAEGTETTAIALIEVANFEWIRASGGSEVAEESLLRAVIKLRALLRDIDLAARIGEARFGVILEGVSTRERASWFASRLVAAGLMGEQGARGDVPLHFHVVVALLDEYAPSPDRLLAGLASKLAAMSPRTRKPIRFLTANDVPDAAAASGALPAESEDSEPAAA